MKVANTWKDYELIASSNGQKLERWKDIYLLRPDPQAIWDQGDLFEKYRSLIHAVYYRSNKGGGHWENQKKLPLYFHLLSVRIFDINQTYKRDYLQKQQKTTRCAFMR